MCVCMQLYNHEVTQILQSWCLLVLLLTYRKWELPPPPPPSPHTHQCNKHHVGIWQNVTFLLQVFHFLNPREQSCSSRMQVMTAITKVPVFNCIKCSLRDIRGKNCGVVKNKWRKNRVGVGVTDRQKRNERKIYPRGGWLWGVKRKHQRE